jgi:RHS repeat-associated protein
VTARGADTFAYDQANRMTSTTTGGVTTSYVYDANQTLPVVLTDGSRKYVYGLSLAYSVDAAGNVQVYHTDGLGSVRALTDGSGNLIETYQTDPFGVPTAMQGASTQPFQFTGQQRDSSGLIYLRARRYDPTIGGFLSRNPLFGEIRVPLSLHRFAYAQDNPISLADRSGLTTDVGGAWSEPSSVSMASDPALGTSQGDPDCLDATSVYSCVGLDIGPGGALIAGSLKNPRGALTELCPDA